MDSETIATVVQNEVSGNRRQMISIICPEASRLPGLWLSPDDPKIDGGVEAALALIQSHTIRRQSLDRRARQILGETIVEQMFARDRDPQASCQAAEMRLFGLQCWQRCIRSGIHLTQPYMRCQLPSAAIRSWRHGPW